MRRSRKIILGLVIAAAIIGGALWRVSQQSLWPGTYYMEWRMDRPVNPTTNLAGELKQVSPASVREIKGLKSRRPYLGKAGPLTVVLDESRGAGTGYDTAYVYSAYPRKGASPRVVRVSLKRSKDWLGEALSGSGRKTPIDLHLGAGTDDAVVQSTSLLSVFVRLGAKRRPTLAGVEVQGGWYCKIRSGFGVVEAEPLRVARDLGILPREEAKANTYHGVLSPGEVEQYRGKLYVISVSSSGRTVKINPYRGPVVSVRITAKDGQGRSVRCESGHVGGPGDFDASGDDDVVCVPGKYLVVRADIRRFAGGLAEGWGRSPWLSIEERPFDVPQTDQVVVEFGGPMKMEIDPGHATMVRSRSLTGTMPVAFSVARGKLTAIDPAQFHVRIIDSLGKACWSGVLRYSDVSQEILATYPLKLPVKLKPGTYNVRVSYDASWWQGKLTAEKTLVVR